MGDGNLILLWPNHSKMNEKQFQCCCQILPRIVVLLYKNMKDTNTNHYDMAGFYLSAYQPSIIRSRYGWIKVIKGMAVFQNS